MATHAPPITLPLLLLLSFCSVQSRLSNFLQRASVYDEPSCEQWIVITSINDVTESVSTAAALKGWCVVIVGDRKGPSSFQYKLDGVVHLDVFRQKKLGYYIHELLPYDSYARKNIGYLYAIQHGARVIYETDDDNQILSDLSGFLPSTAKNLLVYDHDGCCVNPYAHFGQPSIWPRGYPLSKITEPDETNFMRQTVNSWIQQSLADGDPDVDAIFRLTRKTHGQPIDIRFDHSAEPVSLRPHTFCPYNSQNTLHYRPAFWALLIPIGVSFRVSDIWRSYWAQRLLWQVGGQLTFLPPFVYQSRNAHDYLSDFKDELQLYTATEELIQFLTEWRPRTVDFMDQILELSVAMAEEGFWSKKDSELVHAWCADLRRVGYSFPAATSTTTALARSLSKQQQQHVPQLQKTVMMKGLQVVSYGEDTLPYVTLFICILAAPQQQSLRDVIRETYLSFLDDFPEGTVEYRFFTDYRDAETRQQLLQENELYGDLHISDADIHCPPGQHCKNSFGLVIEALDWALEHYDFDYFLRLDLDGYLCLPQLIQNLEHRPKRAYVAGNFGCHDKEPDRFFRADGAFILFTHDVANSFMKMQPLLYMDIEKTFAINFASFTFHLEVVYEHLRWTTNISSVCERQVFIHWLKIENRIHRAHKLALSRVRGHVPVTVFQPVCENRVRLGTTKVCQVSEFWGQQCIDIRRHWPKR